ncbi:MAG: VPLPA-CTERM sorting domain-containing protein [Nitrospira sp.]|nr:VPLPA-CTERM sorting domain-containing protein [Nitrospira sp.]
MWGQLKGGHAKQVTRSLALVALGLVLAGGVESQAVEYYVGIDGREIIPTGTYAGLPNPNYGRVTFLFAHMNETDPTRNHYHGIGAYSYSGPAEAPWVNPTNANNRIPETYTRQEPLPLFPGEGVHAGLWVSRPVPELEYSFLQWAPIDQISGAEPGSPEHYLFHSSGGRWTRSLAGTRLALQVVGLTPGLRVMDETGTTIFTGPGQTYVLGEGDRFSFFPTLYTVAVGESRYTASFRLIDLNGVAGESGIFHFDVRPVPLPAAVWLMLSGLASVSLLARQRPSNSQG